jgi:hypothetical protein
MKKSHFCLLVGWGIASSGLNEVMRLRHGGTVRIPFKTDAAGFVGAAGGGGGGGGSDWFVVFEIVLREGGVGGRYDGAFRERFGIFLSSSSFSLSSPLLISPSSADMAFNMSSS